MSGTKFTDTALTVAATAKVAAELAAGTKGHLLVSALKTFFGIGTTTNDNAAAGQIGEYISSTVLAASAVATADSTTVNVTSISLTAGDWDVSGVVCFEPASGTITTSAIAGITTTSAVVPTRPASGGISQIVATTAASLSHSLPVGTTRISLAATTTVYLIARCQFSVSTMGTYGFIGARRAR